MEITLTGGAQYSERVGTVRSTAENPMSRDDVIAKATDLVAPVLGAAACQKLVARVLALEKVQSMVEIRPLVQLSR